MRLDQALRLEALSGAQVVAGSGGVEREVRWANVVDIPDPLPWVGPGQLLLTTGISWPKAAGGQRRLVRELAERELAGVVLAVPKYLDHFAAPALAQADQAGLPLLEVPWAIPFGAITHDVNTSILREQYAVIEQAATIHKELTKAALTATSLQDLADTLGRLIDRDITFEDPDGTVMASWSQGGAVDQVREATLSGGATPKVVLGYLERSGQLARIRVSPGPVRVPPAPDLSMAGRVACPIWLRGELVGTVWIVEGENELSDLHLRAAEHAAVVAALHIASQRQLAEVEVRLGATFLDALLEGRFEATASGLERARLLGFAPDGAYRVGVLVLRTALPLTREGITRRDRMAEQVRRRLHRLQGVAVTSARLNQVAFLLPDGIAAEAVWEGRPGEDSALAVGRPHQGAEGVRRSYLEALSIAGDLSPGSLRRYDQMLVLRVLSGDAQARQDFIEQLLGPAREARGGGTLLRSLITLAECGFHRRRAAAALHVHPNTLRYRMERVTDLLGLDLDDPEVRFQLQLAAQLMSLAHKPAP